MDGFHQGYTAEHGCHISNLIFLTSANKKIHIISDDIALAVVDMKIRPTDLSLCKNLLLSKVKAY